MSRAFVAFGSNLEAPQQQINAAVEALAQEPGLRLVRASSLYRTAPVDSSEEDVLRALQQEAEAQRDERY